MANIIPRMGKMNPKRSWISLLVPNSTPSKNTSTILKANNKIPIVMMPNPILICSVLFLNKNIFTKAASIAKLHNAISAG